MKKLILIYSAVFFAGNIIAQIKQNLNLNSDFTVAGISMHGIQGGTFTMGSNSEDASKNEYPHMVTVGNFAIMKTEVTVAQFGQFIKETAYQTEADKLIDSYGSWIWNTKAWGKKDSINWKCDVNGKVRPESEYNHPVVHVSWNDAEAFSQWLSKKTGQTWRLPTEAEWEYAAKGGEKYKFSGSNNLDSVAWYTTNTNNTGTKPVGQKSPNGYNLYDMSGNVWEWCQDWYDENYYKNSSSYNPQGQTSGTSKVLRGGSWFNGDSFQRITFRNNHTPNARYSTVGFRMVLVY